MQYKTLMLVYIHPRRVGVDISTWRGGGLYISERRLAMPLLDIQHKVPALFYFFNLNKNPKLRGHFGTYFLLW